MAWGPKCCLDRTSFPKQKPSPISIDLALRHRDFTTQTSEAFQSKPSMSPKHQIWGWCIYLHESLLNSTQPCKLLDRSQYLGLIYWIVLRGRGSAMFGHFWSCLYGIRTATSMYSVRWHWNNGRSHLQIASNCSSKQQTLWDQLSHTQFDMGLKIPPNCMVILHDRKLAKWAVCQNLPSFAAFSYLGLTLVLLLPVLPSCQNISLVFTCFFFRWHLLGSSQDL